MAFLAESAGDDAPTDYRTADLELGAGDGVPDYYQLMLLAAALCSGDEALNAAFTANRAAVANYLAALERLFDLAVKAQGDAATASDELQAFVAWPLFDLFVPPDMKAYVQQMAEGLALFADAMAGLTDPDSPLQAMRGQLDGLTDPIAGVAGLSSEMRQTLLDALDEDVLGDLAAYQAELNAMADTMEAAANGLGYLTAMYSQAAALQDALLALVDDIHTFNAIADILAVPPVLAVYGVAKTPGEPFSGLGDYDADGVSNAGVYAHILARGGDVPDYVKAASGANPFYQSDEVPAAGVIGLAVLAGVIAVVAALVLFRNPNRR